MDMIKSLCAVAFLLLVPIVLSEAQTDNDTYVRDTVIVNEKYRYEGQWPEGQGVLYREKIGIYIGTFKNAEPEGPGNFVSIDGNTRYEGDFKNGKRDGYGKLKRPAGFWYEGTFADGYPEGEGTMFYSDGFVFRGEFHLGKPGNGLNNYVSSRNVLAEILPQLSDMELDKEQKIWMKQQVKAKRKAKKDKTVPAESDSKIIPARFGKEAANQFSKWVNTKLVYPYDARVTKQTGIVLLQFCITKEGELADPYVRESSGVPSLDCEALRVVYRSPLWTPAILDGEHIVMSYTFPVIFQLM